MKVATTLSMMSLAALGAAVAIPPFQYNEKDNTFTCAQTTGKFAYCAGGDIIIRCNNGVGIAANCNDNLAEEPPFGNNGLAGCYQSSAYAGDGACTKAGLVYPSTGSGAVNYNKTRPYPIPGTLAGSNVTTSVQAGPASATGNLDPLYKTVWTTSIVVTDCNGTNVPEHTAAPVFTGGHHWANATVTVTPAAVTPTDYLTIAAPQPAAPTVSTKVSTTSSSSVSPSASAPTSTYPVKFTGAAATSRPASFTLVLAAVLAAYALY